MNFDIEFAYKIQQAYAKRCKEICKQVNLPQTAFDILMFLSNNPKYKSARDIVEVRKLKANLVSVNVDRLVKEGYLERKGVERDRRKIALCVTEKAQSIVEMGHALQHQFVLDIFSGLSESEIDAMQVSFAKIEKNLDRIMEK